MPIQLRDKRRPSYFTIDNEVLDDYSLSSTAILCYVAICRCQKEGTTDFSATYLASRVGLSRATFVRYLPELIEKGLVHSESSIGANSTLSLLQVKKNLPQIEPPPASDCATHLPQIEPVTKQSNKTNKTPSASREGRFAKFIQAHFEKRFKITCPWNGREGKTLKSLLADNPSWTDEQICQWIKNYFSSETAKPDRPGLWLSNLGRWSQGPLDAFGKVTLQKSVAAPKKPPSLPAGPLFQVGVN